MWRACKNVFEWVHAPHGIHLYTEHIHVGCECLCPCILMYSFSVAYSALLKQNTKLTWSHAHTRARVNTHTCI